MATPGFLKTGIDFELLVKHYLDNNYYIEITDLTEIKLATELMNHIISHSYGYSGESSTFAQTPAGRFQMIFNSTLQELTAEKAGLIKRSNAIWRLTDSYEVGTDFQSTNGKQIETKVYKNWDTLQKYIEKGSQDYKVFHGADYVLCYLIDSFNEKHWYWLHHDWSYQKCNNIELNTLTAECLPKSIPICYCKFTDNRIIIGKNTFCQ